MRIVENTVAVLIVTAAVAAAIYAGVQTTTVSAFASNSLPSLASSTSQAGEGIQVCPRTGCSAVSCHATSGSGFGHGRG